MLITTWVMEDVENTEGCMSNQGYVVRLGLVGWGNSSEEMIVYLSFVNEGCRLGCGGVEREVYGLRAGSCGAWGPSAGSSAAIGSGESM